MFSYTLSQPFSSTQSRESTIGGQIYYENPIHSLYDPQQACHEEARLVVFGRDQSSIGGDIEERALFEGSMAAISEASV